MAGKRQLYISVIGNGNAQVELEALAEAIGCEIAKRGHILICGGLGGVMNAAARGAKKASGLSLGILPDENRQAASTYLTLSIPTNLSHGRNYLVVLAGDGLIAVGGEFGTLSEMAYALKMKKPLVVMEGRQNSYLANVDGIVIKAKTAKEAVDKLEERFLISHG